MTTILMIALAAFLTVLGMFIITKITSFVKAWFDDNFAKEAAIVAVLICIIAALVILVFTI